MDLKSEKINFYDDKAHHYEDFWIGRDYEYLSEVIAINKLLGNHIFETSLDYGGGYGRLSPIILKHTKHLLLADPSTQQLDLARRKLAGEPNVEYIILDEKGSIPFANSSLDLVVMVRVSHHLSELTTTFNEMNRVLKPGGQAIIEIANYSHFMHRLKNYSHFKRLPKESVEIGNVSNGIKFDTPFFNHNPNTVINTLNHSGFKVVKTLSVSNLRSMMLKKILPLSFMLKIESLLQSSLASIYFGPSIFILVEKGQSKIN
jgi:SAM-dependent methyltransferase